MQSCDERRILSESTCENILECTLDVGRVERRGLHEVKALLLGKLARSLRLHRPQMLQIGLVAHLHRSMDAHPPRSTGCPWTGAASPKAVMVILQQRIMRQEILRVRYARA